MYLRRLIYICFLSLPFYSQGQENLQDTIAEVSKALIIDGDTVSVNVLDEIILKENPRFMTPEERRQYYLLRKRVFRVYPYARKTAKVINEINEDLTYIESKRQRRKYTRKQRKWLKEHFGDEIVHLKRSEGRVLVKLIHRSTNTTAYEMIKEYRGGFNAFTWQQVALLYGGDLKLEYDLENVDEDRMIENIIRKAVEDGLLEDDIKVLDNF